MAKLTKEEEAALREMGKVCHEEMMRGVNPFISPICNKCAKRMPGAKCSEYPTGIPDPILFKEQDCKAFRQK